MMLFVSTYTQMEMADEGSEHDLGDGPSAARSYLSNGSDYRRSGHGLPRVLLCIYFLL